MDKQLQGRIMVSTLGSTAIGLFFYVLLQPLAGTDYFWPVFLFFVAYLAQAALAYYDANKRGLEKEDSREAAIITMALIPPFGLLAGIAYRSMHD